MSDRLPLPTANSASMTGMPINTTLIRYATKKIEPPLACTSFGKRHIVPSPTAEPTVAAITPNLEEKPVFALIFVAICHKNTINILQNKIRFENGHALSFLWQLMLFCESKLHFLIFLLRFA